MNHNDEEYNWKEERAALLILIEELNKAIEITRVENDALERAFEEEKAKWAALEKENAECVVHINQNSIIQVKLTQEDIENNNVDQQKEVITRLNARIAHLEAALLNFTRENNLMKEAFVRLEDNQRARVNRFNLSLEAVEVFASEHLAASMLKIKQLEAQIQKNLDDFAAEKHIIRHEYEKRIKELIDSKFKD